MIRFFRWHCQSIGLFAVLLSGIGCENNKERASSRIPEEPLAEGRQAQGTDNNKNNSSGKISADNKISIQNLNPESPEKNVLLELTSDSSRPRRLTPLEYKNMIQTVFKVDISENIKGFPLEASVTGFRNQVDAFKAGPQQISWFFQTARSISDRIVEAISKSEKHKKCMEGRDPACIGPVLTHYSTMLLRKKLEDTDIKNINKLLVLALKEEKNTVRDAVKLFFEVMLQSPEVLYRRNMVPAEKGDVKKISSYDIASRLSFFIWQSIPDANLLEAALEGKLDDQGTMIQEIERLLEDPKAELSFRAFVEEWLQLSRLDKIDLDPKEYPNFSRDSLKAMKRETIDFFTTVALKEKKPLKTLFTRNITPKDKDVSSIYHAGDHAEGEESGGARSGFLTHASILTLTSVLNYTDPVARGHYVTDRFFCVKVPIPPNGIGVLGEKTEFKTKQERYAKHREDPSCSGCHVHMDPIGFVFENFDRNGVFRVKDELGNEIQTSGEYFFEKGKKSSYETVLEFTKKMENSSIVSKCLIKRFLDFATGYEAELNGKAVEEIYNVFEKSPGTYKDLVLAITNSTAFHYVKFEKSN